MGPPVTRGDVYRNASPHPTSRPEVGPSLTHGMELAGQTGQVCWALVHVCEDTEMGSDRVVCSRGLSPRTETDTAHRA